MNGSSSLSSSSSSLSPPRGRNHTNHITTTNNSNTIPMTTKKIARSNNNSNNNNGMLPVGVGKGKKTLLRIALFAFPLIALYNLISIYHVVVELPNTASNNNNNKNNGLRSNHPLTMALNSNNNNKNNNKRQHHQQEQQKQNEQQRQESQGRITETKNRQLKQQGRKNKKVQEETAKQKKNELQNKNNNNDNEKMMYRGTLNCDKHGGPSNEIANEMIYWKNIPSDNSMNYPNPFRTAAEGEQFLLFEPDESGWNNIRMAFETVVALAVAMGRTLVLPPKNIFWDPGNDHDPVGFEDYFDLLSSSNNASSSSTLKIISFHEFLTKHVMTGQFNNIHTGQPTYPPKNITNWDGLIKHYDRTKVGSDTYLLFTWLRSVTKTLQWDYNKCIAAFPSQVGIDAINNLQNTMNTLLQDEQKNNIPYQDRIDTFKNHPTAVNASSYERLREMLADRKELCIYNEQYQQSKYIHVYGEEESGYRMLIHFYAFLFVENHQYDLYIKRFIRDKIRYNDQIQCAAARIIHQVRQDAIKYDQKDGSFDSMHVRRNDFQQAYADLFLSAEEIYNNNTSSMIQEKRTVYIATDEKDLSFFTPLREHYNLLFMKDYIVSELQKYKIRPKFYGIIDELVSARGEHFIGTFYSTFSGYINRLRGYFYASDIDGSVQTSYYYAPDKLADVRYAMQSYVDINPPYWSREWPICWRDINHGLISSSSSAAATE